MIVRYIYLPHTVCRVFTDRVCLFTDLTDSDRVGTQKACTVARVEIMSFAGYVEAGAATTSTHLSLGNGLEENTLVGLSRVYETTRESSSALTATSQPSPPQ